MADNLITRDVYRQYAHRIVSVLKDEAFYEQFKKRVDKGSSNFKLAKKRLIQDISIDWIDTIEDVLPNLDTIVRNPRKFIVQEEDIVDVSLARSISTESVKFLAQHTNMISKVDKDGMVTPSKILNITKEESFEIYENRFIYTLLLKLKDFVTMRYDKIKKASATQDVLALDLESRFSLPSKKVTFKTEYFAQLSFDEVMRLDPDTLTKIERVAKIDRIITDFLSSSFAKSMRNSAPVRPPIMRTNVILKEPNFKKALTLWQFIETYNATGGFSTSDEVEDLDITSESVDELKNMVTLNTMLFESMYEQHETDMDMEDKDFGDFLRVGDMDFEKDKIDRDEYAQKLDEQIENDEEEENLEESHNNQSDEPAPLEEPEPPEEEKPEKEPEPQPEITPQEESKKGKEITRDVEVEKLVEVEVIRELPPKADQEEVDLDEDAQKFDKHLFEVRKLYKKPEDDKLTGDDIAKVKNAIDRCLNSYRSIKQEEIDEADRAYRIRRRKEDMAKRADAYAKVRAELEKTVTAADEDKLHFGMDPFAYQRAKIATEKREEILAEERKKQFEAAEAEKAKKAEAARIAEEARLAEQRRLALEAEKEEQRRLIEEAKKAEEARLAREARAAKRAEKARIAEEARLADNARLAKEALGVKKNREKQINLVDESKVGIGSINFKDGSQLPYDTMFVTSKAKKPVSLKNRADLKAKDGSRTVISPPAKLEMQPKKKREKNIDAVDESKVGIGSINFKGGAQLPYDTMFVTSKAKKPVSLKNRADLKPKAEENTAEAEKSKTAENSQPQMSEQNADNDKQE